MSERSEFPRRVEPREAQGTDAAPHRIGTRPGEKHFDSHHWCSPFGPTSPLVASLLGLLLVPQKEAARAAGGSTYLLQTSKPTRPC